MDDSIFKFKVEKIKFQSRPNTLEASNRLTWKLAFVVFLVGRLAGRYSVSLKRLSVFNWTLQDERLFPILDEIVIGENKLAAASVKYEPSLSRALLYLKSLKLVEVSDGKYWLTGMGMKFAQELEDSTDVFIKEKERMNKFTTRQISEVRILSILGGR